jgi:ribose-phosphate pyrophosphokinase
MKIIKYPDGSSYVIEEEFLPKVVFRVNNYEDLWNLHQYVDVHNHNGYTPTIVIPNLIDAQADKRFNNNESFGLKLVLEFLNKMKANFEIFHPHNSEVVTALLDNVKIINNDYFIKEVLSTIYCENKKIERDLGLFYHQKQELYDNVLLFSSDAGGFKPLMKLADNLKWKGEVYGASKSRKHEDGESKLVQQIDRQDFEGKDILIIDDICVYGGTFKGLSKMLRERNCGKIYLAVSHITIEHHPQDSVFEYFNKVFTTNSKYDVYTAENKYREMITPQNLKIIKLF